MKNSHAAEQARELSRDYESCVLDALGRIAYTSDETMRLFFVDAHLSVLRGDSRFTSRAHDTVALACTSVDVPDDLTRAALDELSRNRPSDLGDDLTFDDISRRQRIHRDEIVARARKLSMSRLRRFKSRRRRRQEWLDLLSIALDTLNGLPASGAVFQAVFTRVLTVAGFTPSVEGYALIDGGEAAAVGAFTVSDFGPNLTPQKVKKRATDQAAQLRERWATILVWVQEATHDAGGDATEDFELGPRKRFGAAMAVSKMKVARQAAEQEAETLRAATEKRRVRQLAFAADQDRKKQEAVARRRRTIEELRRNPLRVEPGDEKEGGRQLEF